MKKMLALILCLALCCALASTAAATGDVYVVAGSAALCNNENWAATSVANTMKENADGTYSITFSNIQPGNYEFKIVRNGAEWLGDPDNWSQNYAITVKSVCDVTITYDPYTGYAKATGQGVTAAEAPDIKVMSIRGEGLAELDWNNGIAMTKVGEGVYEYTFKALKDATLSIKFAANGNWEDYNFGGSFVDSGEMCEAVWSGENISIIVSGTFDVKIRLDLSSLDYTTKQGAFFVITYTPASAQEPTPTEPSVTETTATEPAPTTPSATEPGTSNTDPLPTEGGNTPAPTDPTQGQTPAPTAPNGEEPQPSQPGDDHPSDNSGITVALIVIAVGVVLAGGILLSRKLRKKA